MFLCIFDKFEKVKLMRNMFAIVGMCKRTWGNQ